MSRAIPDSWNEYKFDQLTRNQGIVCNGKIMPLRTLANPADLDYKKVLRGEDPAFLREAIYTRGYVRADTSANTGLADNQIRADRMVDMRNKITQIKGAWTDADPTNGIIGMYLGWQDGYTPSNTDVANELLANFTPITQFSANDNYATLDMGPVTNLFKDVKQMNYSYYPMNQSYSGFTHVGNEHYHYWVVRGHTDGTSDRDQSDRDESGSRWFYDAYHESIRKNRGYPNDIYRQWQDTITQAQSNWEEQAQYKTRHECISFLPAFLCECHYEWSYSWSDSTVSPATGGNDSDSHTRFILWIPANWWDGNNLPPYQGGRGYSVQPGDLRTAAFQMLM